MARIPDAELELLKAEISVERLVEASGISLKPAGKDLLGRCPFHDDREASLVVTPAKNLWHCFACQIGGGPIDWVMKTKGVSFRHAVELFGCGRDQKALLSRRLVLTNLLRANLLTIQDYAQKANAFNRDAAAHNARCRSYPVAPMPIGPRGL
jgi:hypothetical protein